MSKTATITIRLCTHDLVESMRRVACSMAEFGAAIESAFATRGLPRHVQDRRRERRRYAALRKLAADDPHLYVELRTTADGVCRVVAKRLGDWGCDCEIHREHRAKTLAGGGAGSSACTASGENGAGTETDRAPLPSVKAPPAGPGAVSPDLTGRPAGGGQDG